jgi:hypothetical protein
MTHSVAHELRTRRQSRWFEGGKCGRRVKHTYLDALAGRISLHLDDASLGRRIVRANSKFLFVTHMILRCDLG